MQSTTFTIPTIAFIGPPNSGKSSLINRICGKKTAIVANEAHTTRDLNIGYDVWEGMYIRYIDTGGLVPDPSDVIQSKTQIRSWGAMAEADLLIWVIDRKTDPETISDKLLQKLWKTNKPFIIAVKKVDDPNLGREEWEFARMGPQAVIELSALNGYGINTMLDWAVNYFEQKGFVKNNYDPLELYEPEPERRKGKRMRKIKISEEGKVFDYEEQDEVEDAYSVAVKLNYKTVILDVDEVLVSVSKESVKKLQSILELERYKEIKDIFTEIAASPLLFVNSTLATIFEQKLGRKLTALQLEYLDFYEKSLSKISFEWERSLDQLERFGVRVILISNSPFLSVEKELKKKFIYYSPRNLELTKMDTKFFERILDLEKLIPDYTLFVEKKPEFIEVAKRTHLKTQTYSTPEEVVRSVQKSEKIEKERIPKLLILGRPNVGKSTLTNSILGEEKQIVSDIAGTTLNVSEYDIKRGSRSYKLLDTVGVRKAGKRTFGAETFATFRTVEAAHEADVILFVMDANSGITAQDQLVAGIARDTRAALLVVANKADTLTEDRKAAFLKDFQFKLAFLKVADFIWFSATEAVIPGTEYNINQIWNSLNEVLRETTREIKQEEVKTLFNYLMKQKPPKKLRLKKKPVVYALEYISAHPHTFNLIVKDTKTVHWSYVRFLENILKQQFNLANTPVKIKVTQPDS